MRRVSFICSSGAGLQRGELQRFAVADRLTVGVVLPGGNVGEIRVVPSGFTVVTLVFLAEVGPARLLPGQGIPQHQLGQPKEVFDP